MTIQQVSYAPLPGYVDPVSKDAQVAPQQQPATEEYREYSEGDTDEAYNNYIRQKENFQEQLAMEQERENFYAVTSIPTGDRSDDNKMIIALSVTTGGLLVIIIGMLFAVKRR
jgi:hypothetical protein